MFHNCGSAIQSCVQGTVDGPIHSRKIDVSPNLFLSQNSNVGLSQMMNGKNVKTEAGYAGSSPFAFSPPSNYLESRPLMGDASVSSFSSVDSNAQHLNDTLLDGDTSSFGFLAQIPQSFPELAADFTTSSGLISLSLSLCLPLHINFTELLQLKLSWVYEHSLGWFFIHIQSYQWNDFSNKIFVYSLLCAIYNGKLVVFESFTLLCHFRFTGELL